MVRKIKNIAIIPARSGSKGLKDKNIKLLHGKPLMAYSIIAAQKSKMFSNIIVFTDNERYADIAIKFGAEVPFLRSEKTSTDSAGSWDVVREVLNNIAEGFDTVCLLQPTSPLRTSEDIIGGYIELIEKNGDAITGVCETDHSPLWTMPLDKDLSMENFRKRYVESPRQFLQKYYMINGALYIRRLQYNENEITILDRKEYAYIMDKNRSIDIDTLDDFRYAEFLSGGGFCSYRINLFVGASSVGRCA